MSWDHAALRSLINDCLPRNCVIQISHVSIIGVSIFQIETGGVGAVRGGEGQNYGMIVLYSLRCLCEICSLLMNLGRNALKKKKIPEILLYAHAYSAYIWRRA